MNCCGTTVFVRFATPMHYPETRLALMRIWRSGGGFDLDIISEVLDAAHEAHGCAGLVITSKVVRSEVAKEGTVAQHMVDGGEDRCGDRDGAPAAAWPQTNVNVAPDNTSGPQLPVPSVQDFGISLQGLAPWRRARPAVEPRRPLGLWRIPARAVALSSPLGRQQRPTPTRRDTAR